MTIWHCSNEIVSRGTCLLYIQIEIETGFYLSEIILFCMGARLHVVF